MNENNKIFNEISNEKVTARKLLNNLLIAIFTFYSLV